MTYEQIIVIVFLVIIVITLVCFFATFIAFLKQNRDLKQSFKDAKNTMRVFILDIKKGECIAFNRSDLKRKKRTTITDFYNEFSSEEREKLILWIGSLLDPTTEEDQYLDVNVLVNGDKNKYFSMLLVEKVDHENQIIHLNSYLLKYMTKSNANKGKQALVTKEKFTKLITESRQQKGITFCINFYHLRSQYKNKKEITHLAITNIKDLLLPYLNNEIIMHEYSDHQLIITYLSLNTRYASLQFVKTIKNEISKMLTLHSLTDIIGFTFGAAENKLFVDKVDDLITSVVSLADFGMDSNEQLSWYNPGMKLEEHAESEYRTEVERIIRDKKLRYQYRAIYDTKHKEILGYESLVSPIDSTFDNIDELKKYASKTGDEKELFSTISRNVISRFISEKNGLSNTLFFPVSYQESRYIVASFGHIKDIKEVKIVVIFDENEFINFPSGTEDTIINQLRQLKSKGYEIALRLNDNQLTLAHEVYASFDYYVIDVGDVGDKHSDSRNVAFLHGLIERLLPFKRPIITVSISNWNTAELVMKLGIELVSGDVIGPSNEMVLPLSQKSIKKLESLNI